MDREEKLYNIAFEEVKQIYEVDKLIYNKERSTDRHLMFTKNLVDDKPFAMIDKLYLHLVQIRAIEDYIELYGSL